MDILKPKKMNKYLVFFDIYGKKMKAVVEANSAINAKKVIQSKLKIVKIKKEEDIPNMDTFCNGMFKDIFNK